ncbi:hypothetical protein ACFCV3_00520 [Kribbella sp. NPDC056345]|uniref:hypothetical protein n=1 Tax=Kribbella sp. NPDC056345 TaxID=3345789 RepID=UPI0035DFEBC2
MTRSTGVQQRTDLLSIEETDLTMMRADRWRLEAGERRLAQLLQSSGTIGTVTIFLVDVDGSMTVRRLGVGPKLELLDSVRRTTRHVLGEGVLTIDGGQRDKTYVILSGLDPAASLTAAERLCGAIAATPLVLGHSKRPVPITVSIGVAVLSGQLEAFDCMERARDALVEAKKHRNCARIVECPGRPWDRGTTGWIRRGMDLLGEKHGPIWHWTVTRCPQPAEALGRLAQVAADQRIPAPAQVMFQLMASSAIAEGTAEAWRGEQCPTTLMGFDHCPEEDEWDLVVPVLPARWIALRRGGTSGPVPESAAAMVRAAVWGASDDPPVPPAQEIQLGPWGAQVLEKLAGSTRRGRDSLIAEAIDLGRRHQEIWSTP